MPSAMRYQATAAQPDRSTKDRNGLMTKRDERNAITSPTAISRLRAGDRCPATSSRSCANAADIVGIATKNENSAAAVPLNPAAMPPMIVAPERDTPGTSAKL